MRDDKELLPCPFCGSVYVSMHQDWKTGRFGCMCDECKKGDTEGHRTTKQAAKAWNRRYTEDDLK